jgi:hypothetical protein
MNRRDFHFEIGYYYKPNIINKYFSKTKICDMDYLTEKQMKRERPLKIRGLHTLNALVKYLNQSSNIVVNGKKNPSVSRLSVFYAPRKNQVIVMN